MIALTSEWTKSSMARAVPGSRWAGEHDSWVVDEVTPRSAAVILKLFPALANEHPELAELRAELLEDVRPFDRATPYVEKTDAKVDCPRIRNTLDARGWALHSYQETDLAYAAAVLRAHGAFYLGWERGLGKTLGTCCLIEDTDATATLVVAPNTAKDSVWAEALRDFCPWLEVLVLPNNKGRRERMMIRAAELRAEGTPFVLVVHYEALAIIAGKDKTKSGKTSISDGWKRLGITWDLLVTDEDHRLSNPQAQMYKAACKVPRTYALQLSGSIIQNHLEELYSPLHRAFPDRYKSRWRDWNDRFLAYVESGYARVCVGVLPERVPALRDELGVFMTYRRKDDELDLPPVTTQEIRLEISPGQRKVYDQLVDECLATLEDGTTVKAVNHMAMLTKLRQVAVGLDVLSGEVHDSVILDAALEEVLDHPDDEYVIFAWHRATLAALHARLQAKGVECFCVDGDVPHVVRADYIARFQAGEGKVFLGTLSTLAESVNLQRANKVIRVERSYNPAMNVQATDRVARQGQTRPVTVIDFVAKNTVDELQVLPVLANKEALRAAILGGT